MDLVVDIDMNFDDDSIDDPLAPIAAQRAHSAAMIEFHTEQC